DLAHAGLEDALAGALGHPEGAIAERDAGRVVDHAAVALAFQGDHGPDVLVEVPVDLDAHGRAQGWGRVGSCQPDQAAAGWTVTATRCSRPLAMLRAALSSWPASRAAL